MKSHPQLQRHIKIKKTLRSDSVNQNVGILVLKEEFDEQGRKIRETAYDKNQKPVTITDWELNQFGDCISQTVNYVNQNDKTVFFFDYVYRNGNKVKSTKHDAQEKQLQEHIFKYGVHAEETIMVRGEISKIKTYDKENRLLISEVNMANAINNDYQYDSHGTMTEVREKRMNKPDKVIKYENEYDKEHRLISQRRGGMVIEFEYNEQNYIDKQTTLKKGKTIEVFTYSYSYYAP